MRATIGKRHRRPRPAGAARDVLRAVLVEHHGADVWMPARGSSRVSRAASYRTVVRRRQASASSALSNSTSSPVALVDLAPARGIRSRAARRRAQLGRRNVAQPGGDRGAGRRCRSAPARAPGPAWRLRSVSEGPCRKERRNGAARPDQFYLGGIARRVNDRDARQLLRHVSHPVDAADLVGEELDGEHQAAVGEHSCWAPPSEFVASALDEGQRGQHVVSHRGARGARTMAYWAMSLTAPFDLGSWSAVFTAVGIVTPRGVFPAARPGLTRTGVSRAYLRRHRLGLAPDGPRVRRSGVRPVAPD